MNNQKSQRQSVNFKDLKFSQGKVKTLKERKSPEQEALNMSRIAVLILTGITFAISISLPSYPLAPKAFSVFTILVSLVFSILRSLIRPLYVIYETCAVTIVFIGWFSIFLVGVCIERSSENQVKALYAFEFFTTLASCFSVGLGYWIAWKTRAVSTIKQSKSNMSLNNLSGRDSI